MTEQMEVVFTRARTVRDLLAHRQGAVDGTDKFYEITDLIEVARKGLHGAIESLPDAERSLLVAMYETLRTWAY